MLTGIPVSKGISIGEAHILDRSKLCVLKQTIDSSDIDKEIIRFRIAIEQTKKQMQETKKKASEVADKYSIILDTYTLLLDDDILVNDTVSKIRKEKINAEWAITETGNGLNIRNRDTIGPLLESHFNQSANWNDYCPGGTTCTGDQVPNGCVAVSMSAIMHYWAIWDLISCASSPTRTIIIPISTLIKVRF
jgi:hypothetical protein